jgi:hypothetical protein
MRFKVRKPDVAEVDLFFNEQKSLSDAWPVWKDSDNPSHWTATWPILDSNRVVIERTRLVFTCKKSDTRRLSVSVLYKDSRVAAVDLVGPEERKDNPPMARHLGLPPFVLGPHFHLWEDNREHVSKNGMGELKMRRPTPTRLTTLPQALKAIVQPMNFMLTPEQLSFDVPRQGYLPLGDCDDL